MLSAEGTLLGEINGTPRGAFKADAESVRVLQKVQDGDMIFTHPMNSSVAWAIMYVTDGGPWSHVGNLTRKGTVIEATTQGMIERSARHYFDGNYYIGIVSPPVTDEQRANMVVWLRARLGAGYNWRGVIRLGFHELLRARPQLSIDVLLVLLGLWIITPVPVARTVIAVVAIAYVCVVARNRRRFKKPTSENWPSVVP